MKFIYELQAAADEIDILKHVNNQVYLNWLMKAAVAHSSSLGYGMQKFVDLGAVFVVRRHEIDYLASAYLGDEIIIETWVSSVDGARCMREYIITRKSDKKILVQAKTLWVHISLENGRPISVPEDMKNKYMQGI